VPRPFLRSLKLGTLQLKHSLAFSPLFWRFRGLLAKLSFLLGKKAFAANLQVQKSQEASSIFIQILRSIFAPLLLAALLVFGLSFLEQYLIHRWHAYALVSVGLSLDQQSTVALLSTLVQVAGVFLGLYFTAVSIIVSTVYVRVSPEIRHLLTREKVGNLYLRSIALLGAVALLLLAQSISGLTPATLNLFLVIILGLYAIYGFVVIGFRAFVFFDPSALAGYLRQDIGRWITSATPRGIGWQDQSFQAHYQKSAEHTLATFESIVVLATDQEHLRKQSLIDLGRSVLALWQYYSEFKITIPTSSLWFKRMPKHKDWLTTDFSQTSLHLQTGTSLEPEMVPDHDWVERSIGRMLSQILDTYLSQNDLANAADLMNSIGETLGIVTRNLSINESLDCFRILSPTVIRQVRKLDRKIDASDNSIREIGQVLGLMDLYLIGLINVLITFSESLDARWASFSETITRIKWHHFGSIYASPMPRPVVERLEELHSGLTFEKKVEGHVVSPLWYQQQLAALGFARFIETSVSRLVQELEACFSENAQSLESEGYHIFSAQLVQRGLESAHKYLFHLRKIRQCFDQIATL